MIKNIFVFSVHWKYRTKM